MTNQPSPAASSATSSTPAHVTVVEALPPEYYEDAHLPGAINIPHTEVRALAPQLLPDKDAAIVVYCANEPCPNSGIAVHVLGKLGYTNVRDYAERQAGLARRRPAARAGAPGRGVAIMEGWPAARCPARPLPAPPARAPDLVARRTRAPRPRGHRRDARRRLPGARQLPPGPRAVGRRHPAVGLPRPHRLARHLRPARRLGRAVRVDPPPRPPPRRPAHRRPRRAPARRRRRLARRRDGPHRGARRDRRVPAHADRRRRALRRSRSACSPRSPSATAPARELRYTVATAAATTAAVVVGLVVLLPPRGEMDAPQYYAYGADIPRALDAVASVRRSGAALDQELDAQLVGLARLVTAPAGRTPVEGRPRVTIASDLHNNVITLPILERARGQRARVLPRRPVRPRLAARDRARGARRPTSATRSCSSPATTTPTARPRSWPTTARSCSPSSAGSSAAAASAT